MIQIRPRSSNVIATGLTMSGSPATSSTVEALGHRHLLDRFVRRQRRPRRLVLGVGMTRSASEPGLCPPVAQFMAAASAAATARFFGIIILSAACFVPKGGMLGPLGVGRGTSSISS